MSDVEIKDISPKESTAKRQSRVVLELVRAMRPEERAALGAVLEEAELTREMRASGIERTVKQIVRGAGGRPWSAYSPLESRLIYTLYELDQLDKGKIVALSEPSRHALYRIAEEGTYIAIHGVNSAPREPKTITQKPLQTRWLDLRRAVQDFGSRLHYEFELIAENPLMPVLAMRINRMHTRKFSEWQESLSKRWERWNHGQELLAVIEPLVETLRPPEVPKDRPERQSGSGRQAAWVDRTQQNHASEIER